MSPALNRPPSGSLVSRLVRETTWILAGILAGVGVVTGSVLHHTSVRGVDDALLAAAQASAHPPTTEDWMDEVEERVGVHVQAGLYPALGGDLPADWITDAQDGDAPHWYDLNAQRVLLLPLESAHLPEGGEGPHRLIVAFTPLPTLTQTVLPFFVIYSLVAGAALAGGAALMRWRLRGGLAPLAAAAEEAQQVTTFAQGMRLTEAGPSEIRAMLAAINQLLERLERAWGAQARFTAEAAHELRTPVTVLKGEIELALRRPRTATQYQETLQTLLEEVDRLEALVQGLLMLARVEGGQPLGAEELTLEAWIEGALAPHREALAGRGGVVVEEVGHGRVVGSRALLTAAVENLVRNAQVHGGRAGVPLQLRVTATQGADGTTVCVEDNGPGIPATERAALQDRLTRGGKARAQGQGLGLGLTLAREIAARHGGQLTLGESAWGGLRATLHLPDTPDTASLPG